MRIGIGIFVCWLMVALGEATQTGGARAEAGAQKGGARAAAECRIAGVVVDASTGAPVVGAELWIQEAQLERRVKADGEGRFAFEGLEAGKYAVNATAAGYVREGFNQHGSFSTAMVVGPGLDAEHMVFRLHRQAVITGTVTDEHGEAVRKASVMLFREQRGPGKGKARIAAQMQTDDLGGYRFAHLEAGKYYVAVTAQPWYAQPRLKYPGQAQAGEAAGSGAAPDSAGDVLDVVYATTFYPGVAEEQSAGEVAVNVGEMQVADVGLLAVASMHVRITNMPTGGQNGSGVAIGVTRKFFDSMSIGVSALSGQVAPGVYEVANLPPGDVTLTINETGGREDWGERVIHANLRPGETVDASTSGALANVSGRVVLAPGSTATMRGQVILEEGAGQSFARNLEKDGTFSVQGVEAGTYEVSVNRGVEGEYVERMSAAGAKTNGREVTIEGVSDVQLVIRVAQGMGQVKGVVKVEGKPAPGVLVVLAPASGGSLERDERMDLSDSDGSFTLGGLVPGKYVVVAVEDGWDLDWEDAGVWARHKERGMAVKLGPREVKNVEVEAVKRSGELRVEK
jgi:Carboxypeptidase regulatory-like domain